LVISKSELGVTDNVFVHGADPIRAQRICDEMRSVARPLMLKDIIRNPTVREQALLLAQPEEPTFERQLYPSTMEKMK
jgi:aryl carrier-like protein